MSAPWTFVASSEAETNRLGRALADVLPPGTTIALVGGLGAGKTRFVRALAEGAGVPPGTVNSPTFVLVQEYAGRWPLYHFDTYRLRSAADEFLALGGDEYLAAGGVCCIEWADRIADVLPADHLQIEIRVLGEFSREFQLRGTGPQTQQLVREMARLLPEPTA